MNGACRKAVPIDLINIPVTLHLGILKKPGASNGTVHVLFGTRLALATLTFSFYVFGFHAFEFGFDAHVL